MTATIENINKQIYAIQNNIAAQNTQLNNHLADMDGNINTINTKIKMLNNEDDKIHQEIHDLASDVENNDTRLKRIEVKNIQGQIDDVRDSIDVDVQQQIAEMDLEHHNELHLLANNIDAHSNRLNKLELKGASIPEHVFVSEADYEKITPMADKFYFTYEDE